MKLVVILSVSVEMVRAFGTVPSGELSGAFVEFRTEKYEGAHSYTFSEQPTLLQKLVQ